MKNKLLKLLLIPIVAFIILLSGCSKKECTHSNRVLVEHKDATCTDDEVFYYSCPDCGNNITILGESRSLGHNYIVTESKDATCEEDGFIKKVCDRCGDTITETKNKLGHKSSRLIKETNSTCAIKGYKLYLCSNCNEEFKVEKDLLPHDLENLYVAPTCTKEGIVSCYKCKNCGNYYLNHDGSSLIENYDEWFIENGKLEKMPHEYVDGTCKNCGKLLSYTLNFYNGSTLINSVEINKETKISDNIPIIDDVPSKSFIGFYVDNGDVKIDDSFDNFIDFKQVINAYAKFESYTEIKTKQDFLNIKNNLDTSYSIMNDINLEGENLEQFGDFTGSLNGNNHKIYNFSFSKNGTLSKYALFKTNSGTIKNIFFDDFVLNLKDSTLNLNVGCSFLVYENTGIIDNIKIKSESISFSESINGEKISGFNYYQSLLSSINKGIIKNCNIDAKVSTKLSYSDTWWGAPENYTSNYYIGSVSAINEGEITNCIVNSNLDIEMTGSINSGVRLKNNTFASLTVGKNKKNIKNVFIDGNIDIKTSNSELNFNRSLMIGGAIGSNDNGVIKESSSITNINHYSLNENSFYTNDSSIGSLVGENINNSRIDYCYSQKSIIDIKANYRSTVRVGGAVGLNQSLIQNTYSSDGEIYTYENSTSSGGFVGLNNDSGSILKSYTSFDTYSNNGNSGPFVGKSSGVITKCYYISSVLNIKGNATTVLDTNNDVKSIKIGDLINPEFLTSNLYWDDEIFELSSDTNPLLIAELNSVHDMHEEIEEATCSSIGYTKHYCSKCSLVFFTDQHILEHDLELINTINPTCTEKGYSIYQCKVCKEQVIDNYVDALGHDTKEREIVKAICNNCSISYNSNITLKEQVLEDINNGIFNVYAEYINDKKNIVYLLKESDLDTITGELHLVTYEVETETPGLKKEVKCDRCGDVIFEEEIIEPHNYIETILLNPTCVTYGVLKKECKNCGHIKLEKIDYIDHDYNNELICNVCEEQMYDLSDGFTAINTVDEFLNMILTKKYYLNADLDFNNISFTSIGDIDYPFRGVLIGNNHIISNVKIDNITSTGLFGYNSGTIFGLIVENLTVDNFDSGTIGGIAAINEGEIINCEVKGNISITNKFKTENEETTSLSEEYELYLGVIAGNNKGKIYGCKVTGEYNNMTSSNAILTVNSLSTIYKDLINIASSSQKLTVYNGGISGINSGSILNSSFNPSKLNNKVNAYPKVMIRGKAYTIINDYDGSITGMNTKDGIIESFEGVKNPRTYTKDGRYVNTDEIMLSSLEYIEVNEFSLSDGVDGYIGINLGLYKE